MATKLVPSSVLAVALLYLLTENGVLDFPTSTSSGPSKSVLVTKTSTGPASGLAEAVLPLSVKEKIWRLVAVPVLNSPVWESYGIKGRNKLRTISATDALRLLEAAIEGAYKDAGLTP